MSERSSSTWRGRSSPFAKDAPSTRRVSYPWRAVDSAIFAFDLIVNGVRCPGPNVVYTKLPGFMFLGFVVDCGHLLEGTRVLDRGALSDERQRITDPRFEPFLTQIISNRLALVEETERRLSPRQLEKVGAALQQELTSTQDVLGAPDGRPGRGAPAGCPSDGPTARLTNRKRATRAQRSHPSQEPARTRGGLCSPAFP